MIGCAVIRQGAGPALHKPAPDMRSCTLAPAGTCILFGDACGAVVMQAAAEGQPCAVLGQKMASDGSGMRHLNAPFHGTDRSEGGYFVCWTALLTDPTKLGIWLASLF